MYRRRISISGWNHVFSIPAVARSSGFSPTASHVGINTDQQHGMA
jgi:hypothetical protein